jgi:hypothetical protein
VSLLIFVSCNAFNFDVMLFMRCYELRVTILCPSTQKKKNNTSLLVVTVGSLQNGETFWIFEGGGCPCDIRVSMEIEYQVQYQLLLYVIINQGRQDQSSP